MAQRLSKNGDERHWLNPDFKKRHTSNYRLTDLGRKQVKMKNCFQKSKLNFSINFFFIINYLVSKCW